MRNPEEIDSNAFEASCRKPYGDPRENTPREQIEITKRTRINGVTCIMGNKNKPPKVRCLIFVIIRHIHTSKL
jgi:hypothetical protein